MYELNRQAVLITPKQAFFDMLAPMMDGEVFKAEEIMAHDSANVYLVKGDFSNEDEVIKYLQKNFRSIFENEIEGWLTDENEWPKKVTWTQFQNWFSISVQSMIFDMASKDPIYETE